jgi:hypothetical protein
MRSEITSEESYRDYKLPLIDSSDIKYSFNSPPTQRTYLPNLPFLNIQPTAHNLLQVKFAKLQVVQVPQRRPR